MGRLKTEAIKISPALLHRTPDAAELTPEILADYGARMRQQGRREDGVRNCEKVLRQFYDALPADKAVTKNSLPAWREQLLSENYAIRFVNSKVSMVNALLESMGCRDFQVTRQLLPEEFEAPELTRREYVRMLQTARSLEDERGYVLTKLCYHRHRGPGHSVRDGGGSAVGAVTHPVRQKDGDHPVPGRPAGGPVAIRGR